MLARSPVLARLRRCLLSALCAGALLAAPAGAQLPDSVSHQPLFSRRDAWFAGGFVLGTVAMAPVDLRVARAVQDSSIQAREALSGAAGVFRALGHPGAVGVAGALYAAGRLGHRPRLADVGLHTGVAIVVAEAATFATKAVVGRARPKLDTDDPFDVELGRGLRHDDYQSFPSGHTSAAFALAAALSTEIVEERPEARLLVGTVLYGGATLVGVSRLYHNEHWASDVVMGAALGSFSGWKVVRYLHARPDNRLDRLLLATTVAPDPAGGGVVVGWVVPTGGPQRQSGATWRAHPAAH